MPQDNLAIASSTADIGKIFQFRKSEIKEFRNLNINLEVNTKYVSLPEIKIDQESIENIGILKFKSIQKMLPRLIFSFPSLTITEAKVTTISDYEIPEWKETVLRLRIDGDPKLILTFRNSLANQLKMIVSVSW